MKTVPILPLLAAALFVAACGNGTDAIEPAPVDTRPGVRFFNAMTGMTGSGGFTTNGQFVTGSALTFGQSTQPCASFEAGLTSFAFGETNTTGTELNGGVLATLPNQIITAGGDFTVAAVGNGKHSLLYMLDNSFTGKPGSNQAAVRFVNLAATANPFNVMIGTSTHATNLEEGKPSAFATVPSGNTAFSILQGQQVALTGSAATLNLQGGTVNTVAIVHNGSMGAGYKLINLPRCS
jgi:hypothetical protein